MNELVLYEYLYCNLAGISTPYIPTPKPPAPFLAVWDAQSSEQPPAAQTQPSARRGIETTAGVRSGGAHRDGCCHVGSSAARLSSYGAITAV